jgi:hypothetical protein
VVPATVRTVRPRVAPMSDFGAFFVSLCDRAGTTPYQVGKEAGIPSKSRVAYALRPMSGKRRAAVLPISVLTDLARELDCSVDEASHLILLGLKEHAPQELREYIAHLEKDNSTLRRKAGMQEARYRFLKTAKP